MPKPRLGHSIGLIARSMRTPRIYTSEVLSAHSRVQLQGQAAHYVSRVLRRNVGDSVWLFNGTGGEYQATVINASRGTIDFEILGHRSGIAESPLEIHLGLAISRGERMDWAVQKATELGVREFTPLLSERCEVKISAQRMAKRCQHWRQIAISACEQCGRNRIPLLHESRPLALWLPQDDADLALVLAHQGLPFRHWSHASCKRLRLLIGPEGGLSESELEQAVAAGFAPAAIGPRILRTETAPVAALTLAQYLWGDL